MFDANASHIKEGELFFGEVHETNQQLDDAGFCVGDIVLCSHVQKTVNGYLRENTLSQLWRVKDGKPFMWEYKSGHGDWAWVVYSGRPDGSGFISYEWKKKALDFLGGKWLKEP